MRKHIPLFLACLTLVLLSAWLPCMVKAGDRVALVIGNANYASTRLKNSANDAKDIAASLEKMNFDVILKTNVSRRQMEEGMDIFYQKLQKAEVGFFFYAGHGVQIDGINYLIPLGASVTSASDVRYEAVPAGRILGKMEDAGNKLNIVVLDACRNNPFRSYFRSASQGLAFMDAPDGTIVAYATSPNSVAADGKGRNGIYTSYLLKNMIKPELNVLEIFNQTGLQVRKRTEGKQTPWVSFSPMEKFYLAGGNQGEVVRDASSSYNETFTTGSLKVTSNPAGAEVQLDGEAVGQTPLHLGNMAVGPVWVSVARSGYENAEQRTDINAGRQTVVTFDLLAEVKNGWLTVGTSPENATVRILNIVPSYSKGMVLQAGRYHVEVSAVGYATEKRWVDLGAGDDIKVDFRLEQNRVEAKVSQPLVLLGRPFGKNYTDLTTGMEFVRVAGGCFQMGDTFGGGFGNEKPVHEVCVDSFYIGKYEVTQGEYQKITGNNPSGFKKGDQYPVEQVSWDDAQAFIGKLNRSSGMPFRLPREAEWEYASRSGGKKELYAGSNNHDTVAWYESNSGNSTHRVGSKGANGLGLYDMSGNVWEWCEDWYGTSYYAFSVRNNPTGPSSGSGRVFRGGSWCSTPWYVRVAGRLRNRPGNRFNSLGFRLVLSGQ